MFDGIAAVTLMLVALVYGTPSCQPSGNVRMKHLWGDALSDINCLGPSGKAYPKLLVESLVRDMKPARKGKSLTSTPDPKNVRQQLLRSYAALKNGAHQSNTLHRTARDDGSRMDSMDKTSREMGSGNTSSPVTSDKTQSDSIQGLTRDWKITDEFAGNMENQQECAGPPARLCKTRYNTTAPMFGISLTSGKPVTIVQKFPDLLQQVIFEVCESNSCDVLHGDCVQTYTPHLFLVIPLGPVTLTGQDYVLVESGCVCRPKYTARHEELSLAGIVS